MKRYLFAIIIISTLSCAKDNVILEKYNDQQSASLYALYDNYFDWTTITTIPAQADGTSIIQLSLPWAQGSSSSLGIPSNWMDNHPNGESLYSKRRGWEMVYSNLNSVGQLKKYFALYNKFTGKMRFFLYSIAPPTGGSSSTHVGVRINGNANSFNSYFADQGISSVINPTIYITPRCTFDFSNSNSSSGVGVGYDNGQWYGIEIDWTYDPTLTTSNQLNLKMWSSNSINGTITGTSTGVITGTVTTRASGSSGFNLSIDASNNTNNNITQSNPESGANAASAILEQTGSFFSGLWNKTKSTIQTNFPSWIGGGIKEGINALFSSGGSLIAKTIGKLFGIGSSGPTISDVDLTTKSDISLNFTGVTELAGWGAISSLPIPPFYGDIDSQMYNSPLGVYRITKLPELVYYRTKRDNPPPEPDNNYRSPIISVEYHFDLKTSNCFNFNPSISEIASIDNFKCELVCTSNYFSTFNESNSGKEFGVYKNINYYKATSYDYTNSINDNKIGKYDNSINSMFKCFVSFDVVNKITQEVHSFFRYIDVSPIRQSDDF